MTSCSLKQGTTRDSRMLSSSGDFCSATKPARVLNSWLTVVLRGYPSRQVSLRLCEQKSCLSDPNTLSAIQVMRQAPLSEDRSFSVNTIESDIAEEYPTRRVSAVSDRNNRPAPRRLRIVRC